MVGGSITRQELTQNVQAFKSQPLPYKSRVAFADLEFTAELDNYQGNTLEEISQCAEGCRATADAKMASARKLNRGGFVIALAGLGGMLAHGPSLVTVPMLVGGLAVEIYGAQKMNSASHEAKAATSFQRDLTDWGGYLQSKQPVQPQPASIS